jgi:hypothetical protein
LDRTTGTKLPGADQRFPPGMQRRVGGCLGHQTGAVGVDEGGGDPAVGGTCGGSELAAIGEPEGSSLNRVADTARRSRLVGRGDVSAVDGRSNRLGASTPQPLAVELAAFCWVAATLSPILAGVRLARSAPVRRPTGGSRTVAIHNHRLKPPRMLRPAGTPKLVVGPSQRNDGRRRAPARTEGTPCIAASRNIALAHQ